MTTPQRWQEIDRIFAAALELEPCDRGQFLAEACADDVKLREEVESLLANDSPESFVAPVVEEATRLISKSQDFALQDKSIGPYKIIRSLGAGGMGHVYLGHDARLNRPVAVKLLSFYDAAADERIRRFRQEALSASALNHPNILTIYEIGEFEDHNFIVTEFVEGQTLQERIRQGAIPLQAAVDIAIQVASALAAAHSAAIVHRDIKPANIMLRPDGLIKVLDFGVAKYIQADDREDQDTLLQTAPGSIIGTASYMSPEQARGVHIDARSDIWSLGVILYEMFAGRRPFLGDSSLDVLSAVIDRHPSSFSQLGLSVPDALERIVLKALQKDKELRYQNANEVLNDLKELRKSLELGLQLEPPRTKVQKSSATSIAVMPFVNMSADPENEYFCDGLSEELSNALMKVEELRVAARTSAFSFKGKSATVSAIGQVLNVSSVLEGSVRKSGDRLRISVQLINASDGYQLWSERYDRQLKDIFDVQDEIALSVVDALKLTLIGKEKAALLKRYTESVEAYELYLKGRYYWWKTAPEEFAKGREYFERALEVDPSYALSYCGLSSYYGFGSAFGMVPPDVGWPRAVASNARSLALDDTLSEVHVNAGGMSMVYLRDFTAAEKEIKRALELNPKFQEAHFIYSFFLLTRFRFEEAIAEANLAVELDPFSPRLVNHLGLSYYIARQFPEAVKAFKRAVELDPKNPLLHNSLADALVCSGMRAEALTEWKTAFECIGDSAAVEQLIRSATQDNLEKTLRLVAQLNVQHLTAKRARGEYVPEIHFVRELLAAGDPESALDRLEKACEERNVFPLLVHSDPLYEGLTTNPKFHDVLRRSNLLPADKADTLTSDIARAEQTGASNVRTSPELKTPTQNRLFSSRNFLLAILLVVISAGVAGLAYWSFRSRSLAAKSIAVLPFKNESGNSELEYLSDGMTDSLINSLSQLPQVTVKAHNSVFRYKNSEIDPQRIASELSVEAILNGRVVQRGDDLTLYLWLVDASNGNQVWGEQYQRKLADLPSLQREIARDVAEKLRLKLTGAAEQRVTKDYTANAEAYRLYLLGRFHVFKLTRPEVQQGLTYFEKATELDPNYALAYVGISEAYRSLALGTEMPPEYLSKAKVAAQKALQLDEELAEAHTAYGTTVFWLERNWAEAEVHYARALELNPNTPDAHLFYAHLLSNTGRHREALAEIARAKQLDPLSPFIGALEGQFLLHSGRIDEALSKLKETSTLAPNFWFPHVFASSAYIEKGMFSDAVREARLATEFSPVQTVSVALEGCALAKMGKRDEARAILDQLLKLSEQRFVPPYHIALLYNALGEREETFKWLERAIAVSDAKVAFLKVEPKWNNLRGDPKFQEIMKRAGF
jgi:TolB-like protein/Flp pilus assembly protein TadD